MGSDIGGDTDGYAIRQVRLFPVVCSAPGNFRDQRYFIEVTGDQS